MQKDFTWDIPKGKSRNDSQVVWDKFANSYPGIEWAESFASLINHDRKYLSVSQIQIGIHNVGKMAVQSDPQSVFDMSASMLETLEVPYQSWLN